MQRLKIFPVLPRPAYAGGMARQNNGTRNRGRRTRFEIVPIPDLPADRTLASPRILSVSFDAVLARTREMILSAAGFHVATYTDLEDAVEACRQNSFDLILIGHSIPLRQRSSLLLEVRALCQAPVLALLRHGEAPLPGADYVFDASQSPVQLLEMVMNILAVKR